MMNEVQKIFFRELMEISRKSQEWISPQSQIECFLAATAIIGWHHTPNAEVSKKFIIDKFEDFWSYLSKKKHIDPYRE
jgi:hypothetical protein